MALKESFKCIGTKSKDQRVIYMVVLLLSLKDNSDEGQYRRHTDGNILVSRLIHTASWTGVQLDFSVRSELPKIPSGARVTPVSHRTCGNTSLIVAIVGVRTER